MLPVVSRASADHRTVMVGVTALRGQYSDDIPTFAAGALIAAVPVPVLVLVTFLFLQRRIVAGATAGATKG